MPRPQIRLGATSLTAQVTSQFLARRLGVLMLFAAATGGVSLLFPEAPYSDVGIALIGAIGAAVAGVTLLLGVLDRAPLGAFKAVIALTTVLAALGTYGAGSPIGGGELFFLWVSLYAFAFFTTRHALAQTGFVGFAYAVVLAVQHHLHPAMGSAAMLAGPWVCLVGSDVAIGILVRHLARSVRDADRRFRRGFEDSPVAAAFVDLDLRLIEVNDALCRLFGRSSAELVGASLDSLRHEVRETDARWFVLDTALARAESRFVRPDGSLIWTEVSGSLVEPEVGSPYGFCQFRDVTELHEDRALLAHQAVHDPLTGLANRSAVLTRARAALAAVETGAPTVGLILLDLDQFKMVNDSLGHEAGDAVLVALAPRLRAATRPGDLVARLGGDEFVVLLESVRDEHDAITRAERIQEAIAAPIRLAGADFTPTASIGVAIAAHGDLEATALLRDADAAMYRAKNHGRDHIVLFDQSMRFEVLQRLQLERDLREAITDGQLYLEFQPVVELATGQPVALEALVRWDHPRRGRVGPEEFIPLAEQTGLIVDLGYEVLARAVAALEQWQLVDLHEPPIAVSVNVSGHQLASPGFVARVKALLAGAAIAPGTLGIEITESVIIDVRAAHEALEALRSAGVVTLLDDFGTGYSSLSYLEHFPIDILKIDRSFVARLDGDSERAVVLDAIFAMAAALHLEVVAEGVESASQLAKLRELGCGLVQGYAISPPLPADAVASYLAEQRTVARAVELELD